MVALRGGHVKLFGAQLAEDVVDYLRCDALLEVWVH